MMKKLLLALAFALVVTAAPALAGPPLICGAIDIGAAPSLPWSSAPGWNGALASYEVAHLGDDTIALLTPQTPVNVRRETLRRAAIYATRQTGLAEALAARLIARATAAEDAGNGPAALFDAGYFVESVRQAARMGQMLPPAQRTNWKLRADPTHVDGLALIDKAIRMGGRDMQPAAAFVAVARTPMDR
ncbi:MAG: hypothetical protein JWM87_3778 [Candidatus Eremiobacteraeota bacterium]|nr:hypothetical protein [Candidatus Eremiobacteraeota bacterium]